MPRIRNVVDPRRTRGMKVTVGNIRSRYHKQPFACEVNETFSRQQSVKNVKFGNHEE
jgi:hypothetical protein